MQERYPRNRTIAEETRRKISEKLKVRSRARPYLVRTYIMRMDVSLFFLLPVTADKHL